eukprot:6210489-Pleurochrysis_carterae.AAC.3
MTIGSLARQPVAWPNFTLRLKDVAAAITWCPSSGASEYPTQGSIQLMPSFVRTLLRACSYSNTAELVVPLFLISHSSQVLVRCFRVLKRAHRYSYCWKSGLKCAPNAYCYMRAPFRLYE